MDSHMAFGDSTDTDIHLASECPSFHLWILGTQTQVLILPQQALC